MDVYLNFALILYVLLLFVESIRCSESMMNLKEELKENQESEIGSQKALPESSARKLSQTNPYDFTEEEKLYNDDTYGDRIEKIGPKSKRAEHGNAIELKDFAAGSSESSSLEPKPLTELRTDPGQRSLQRSPARNFESEKWLHEDVSYANYITDVLGKQYFSKLNQERENHPVSTVFHMPEEYSKGKPDGEKHETGSPVDVLPPITEDEEKFFNEDFSKLSVSVNFNATFENQLEEPEEVGVTGSEVAVKEDSDAETEYYSLSLSQEVVDENLISAQDKKLLSSERVNGATTNNDLKKIETHNLKTSDKNTDLKKFEKIIIHEGNLKNEATADTGTGKISIRENSSKKNETEADKDMNLKKIEKVSAQNYEKIDEKEIDLKKGENISFEENISKNNSKKQKSPRVIQLSVPEHLANDPDRILNAVDLERSYTSRHFGFYNPEPGNRQNVSSFINMIAQESKGYEIRTARIRKRFFKALNEIEKKSFCEEHVNGNIILRSQNLLYDGDADPENIKAIRKTVVYRWKLPPENITTVRCPVKAAKAVKAGKTGVETPSAVYLVPVVYDDEYKSPYTFVFNDCTPTDNCGSDAADRAVRLTALSRVDVDYVIEKMKSKLVNTQVNEIPPNKEEPEVKVELIANELQEKTEDEIENLGKKSLWEPEERKEVLTRTVAAKDLIDKYLKNPSDTKTLAHLRKVLTVDQYRLVQLKAAANMVQLKTKKKEPWLVKMVKYFTGMGKNNKKAAKADFYVDKTFSSPNLGQVH